MAHLSMKKCVENCHPALSALSELSASFEAKLSQRKGLRRGLVMAKSYLQSNELERLQNKLDRSVQLLRWAQNCYVQAQLPRPTYEFPSL